jgi:hypothetical protein
MFKEFIKFCIVVASLFFIIIIADKMIHKGINKEMEKKAIVIDCKLLNRDVKIDRGFKVFISVFDCDNYGILTSDNKEVFRRAEENNRLKVYIAKNDYKIFDIKPI